MTRFLFCSTHPENKNLAKLWREKVLMRDEEPEEKVQEVDEEEDDQLVEVL